MSPKFTPSNARCMHLSYRCDVRSRENVLQMAEKIQKEVGDVSILINNAGIMPCKKFLAHQPEEIKRIFDVNVFAHFWVRYIRHITQ